MDHRVGRQRHQGRPVSVHPCAVTYLCAYSDPDFHIASTCYPHINPDLNSNSYPNTNSDYYPHTNPDLDSNSYPNTISDYYPNRYVYLVRNLNLTLTLVLEGRGTKDAQ